MNKSLHSRRVHRLAPRAVFALGGAASVALALTFGVRAVAQPPAATQATSDWPALRGDVTRRGASPEQVKTPMSLLWRFSAGTLRGNQSAPVVSGDTVYYSALGSGDGGVLFALDTQTGTRKWQYPTDPNGLTNKALFLTAPLVSNGKVYVGASDGNMYVLEASTGKRLITIRTPRPINSAPAINDGILFFGSNDGNMYAVNPDTGEAAWTKFYQSGNAINSAPTIAGGMLYFTTTDNSVHAIREKSGIFRWKLRIPERMLPNAPIFADNVLYVPASQRLYALQGTSGLARWARDLQSDILASPVADSGIVYAITRAQTGGGSVMYAIRSSNGRDVWKKPVALPLAPSAAPTIAGNVILVPTSRNVLMAVSTEDGKVLWEYYTEPSSNKPDPNRVARGGFTGGFGGDNTSANTTVATRTTVALIAPPAVSGGTVYTLADDGSLSAFRSDAPDSTGPRLTYQYPQPGQAVSGQPPVTLAANLIDMGTGINPDSLTLKLDEKEVDAIFDAPRNLIIYTTKSSGKQVDPPLADGRHTATVSASDWRGNKTEQTWSFVVNNALQPARGVAPSAPRTNQNPDQDQNQNTGRSGRRGRRGNNSGGGNTPPPPPVTDPGK